MNKISMNDLIIYCWVETANAIYAHEEAGNELQSEDIRTLEYYHDNDYYRYAIKWS